MDGEGTEHKKRRVTKACDQCRRKRVKCDVYPNSLPDAPCAVCNDCGQAAGCTFSRPSRKRGPTAGYAKSLADRLSTVERLLGHLLLSTPAILAQTDAFFRLSPSSPPSPEAQIAAFQSSSLPALIEAAAPVPSVSTPPDSSSIDAKPTPPQQLPPQPLAAASPADDRMSVGEPSLSIASGWSPVAHSTTSTSTSQTSINHLSLSQRKVLGLPSANTFPRPPVTSNGLHTLASAAANDAADFDRYRFDGFDLMEASGRVTMEGVENGKETESVDGEPSLPTLSLPSEAIRNQLVDLYFNQIVHPNYPMVDKARFFRWSAHLPSTNASTSAAASSLPPELYYAVFASVAPYLSPSASATTHRPSAFASVARAHVFASLDKPTIETVQACCLLALVDWGQGELNRAWILSSLSIALSINLTLHLTPTHPDPTDGRLRTFHSALIVHALLSLRLLRPPMSILEDYDVPAPPQDGMENFELWRSDRSAEELRADHAKGNERDGDAKGKGPQRQHQAVRSCALSTFSHVASLGVIGLAVVRWVVCPRRGSGRGLAAGEQERADLVASLDAWEKDLPPDLRLSDRERGVERLHERSRHTVEMHLLLFTLYLRLGPHISFRNATYDPVPQALAINSRILARYLDLFTFYRSLPTVELSLHAISSSLFTRPDYSPHQHDVPLKAYDELSCILPVADQGLTSLRIQVDQAKRERNFQSTFPFLPTAPSAQTIAPPRSPPRSTTSPPPAQPPVPSTFLDPSLFSSVPDPVLWESFSQWDQTDLLVSLGLVADPSVPSHPWLPPPASSDSSSTGREHHVPHGGGGGRRAYGDLDEGHGLGTGGFAEEGGEGGMGMVEGVGAGGAGGGGGGGGRGEGMVYGYDLQQQQQSTDLLTRWLDRGTLGFGVDALG